MDKVIQNITRGGDDYKLKPEHILGLPAALKRLINKIEYDPATRKFTITNDDAKELAVEIALASATQAGLMSSEMWSKLEGIDAGAQVNPQLGDLATIDRSGDSTLFLDGNLNWTKPPNDNTTDLTQMQNVLPKTKGGTGNTNGTVDQLTTSRNINGVSFNGTAAVDFGGYCATAAATVAKTVTISGYSPTNYSTICVIFRYINTASNPTLNVNSTGAYPIKLNNAAVTKINSAEYQPVMLQFYSNAWHIVDPNANINSVANATNATKATQDESGNNIKSSYAANITISDNTITLKNKNGSSLATVTIPNLLIPTTMSAAFNLNELFTPGAYFLTSGTINNNTSYPLAKSAGTGAGASVVQLFVLKSPDQQVVRQIIISGYGSDGIFTITTRIYGYISNKWQWGSWYVISSELASLY